MTPKDVVDQIRKLLSPRFPHYILIDQVNGYSAALPYAVITVNDDYEDWTIHFDNRFWRVL